MSFNRNTYEYKKWRKKVLMRDGYKCTMCGSTKHLEVHHIISVSEDPDLAYDVGNGKTVCTRCHYLLDGRTYDEYKEYKREYDHELSFPLTKVKGITYWLRYRLAIIRDLVIIFPSFRKFISGFTKTIELILILLLLFIINSIKDIFTSIFNFIF